MSRRWSFPSKGEKRSNKKQPMSTQTLHFLNSMARTSEDNVTPSTKHHIQGRSNNNTNTTLLSLGSNFKNTKKKKVQALTPGVHWRCRSRSASIYLHSSYTDVSCLNSVMSSLVGRQVVTFFSFRECFS